MWLRSVHIRMWQDKKDELLLQKEIYNFCLANLFFQRCFCFSLSELREAMAGCQHHKIILVQLHCSLHSRRGYGDAGAALWGMGLGSFSTVQEPSPPHFPPVLSVGNASLWLVAKHIMTAQRAGLCAAITSINLPTGDGDVISCKQNGLS